MKKFYSLVFALIIFISFNSCTKLSDGYLREEVSIFTYYINAKSNNIQISYWEHGVMKSTTLNEESWHYSFEAEPSTVIQIWISCPNGGNFEGYLGYEGKKVAEFPLQGVNPYQILKYQNTIENIIP